MPKARVSNLEHLFQFLDITTVEDVCTLEELTTSFDAAAISESVPPQSPHVKRHIGSKCQTHELHLEYPAYDLLLSGASPYFARPKNMARREKPHLGYYHIHESNLGCVVRLKTRSTNECSSTPQYEHYDNFVNAINRLHNAPGVSTLEIMSFQMHGVVVCNMRISTTWVTSSGKVTESHSYGCPAVHFSNYLAAHSGVAWADVLDDLVNRASDLSYLYVRDRMMKYSYAAAQAEWETFQWNTDSIDTSANHVLASHLQYNGREEVDNKLEFDVLTLNRCGHVVRISREYLFSVMSPEECIAFCCPTCGVQAMELSAIHKVRRLEDTKSRRAYIAKDAEWAKLYASLRPYVVFEAKVKELRQALQDSLQLLQPPASVMHPSQSPHSAPETEVVLDAYLRKFNKKMDDSIVIVSPPQTAHCLAKIATVVLQGYAGVDGSVKGCSYVPLGYGKFMLRWLKGAVVLLPARVEAKKVLDDDELTRKLVNEEIKRSMSRSATQRRKDDVKDPRGVYVPGCYVASDEC